MMTPESKIKNNLRKLFKAYNVLYYPVFSSMYSPKGFPDHIGYTTNKTHFVVESKAPGKTLSPFQKIWQKDLVSRGQYHFVYEGDNTELEQFLKENS